MVVDQDVSEVVSLRIESLEELDGLVGRSVVTPWFQMDPDRVEGFERSTYLYEYPNPYGDEFGDGYGDGLVEGFHLIAMTDYLLNHVVEIDPELRVIPWNYGVDGVRFISVVRTSDRFRLRGTFSRVKAKPTGMLVTIDIVAEVQGREQPAFVSTQHALWARIQDGAEG